MKNLGKYPLLCAIAVSMLLITLAGWGLRSEASHRHYEGKTEEWAVEPAVQDVMMCVSDGKLPWDKHEKKDEAEKILADAAPQTQLEAVEPEKETEAVTETLISEPETEVYKTYSFTDVPQDYFDDALFIGDSRTVGLKEYSGLDNASFYASVGLTVYDMFTDAIVDENGTKITVEQALGEHQFGKIYLMIGINEMGTGTIDSFMEHYNAAVAHIRELQPDALIFVEGIMYVKQEKSEKDAIFNNPAIAARNDRIAQLANNHDIFYIDVNEVVTDATGNLNPDYSYDEIHLLGKYYSVWTDFLLKHGIVKEQ